MAVGDSIIRVSIIGDVKKLNTAIGEANRSMGGLLGSSARVIGGGFLAFAAIDKGFDAFNSTIDNADRAGDAMGRLASSVGDVNVEKLDSISRSFSDIGVSRPDFLEIVAGFSEFATASGKISASEIESMAGGVAQFAGAMGRLKDVDPATLGDDIANFISGTRGAAAAAKELGLPFDSALTPAERYAQLMEKLPGLLEEVTGANAGLDDKQSRLQAQWETLGSDVGPVFEDVLSGILDAIQGQVDAIPGAIRGYEMLGDRLASVAQQLYSPWARLRDIIDQVISGPGAGRTFQVAPGRAPRSESVTVRDAHDFNSRNGTTTRPKVGGP